MRSRAAVTILIVATIGLVGACVPPPGDPPPPTDTEPRVVASFEEISYASTSDDGRWVAAQVYGFVSDDDEYDVVLHDTVSDTTVPVAVSGYYPQVSDDGRHVAYRHRLAWDAPYQSTVGVFDRTTGLTTNVPTLDPEFSSASTEPSISADGRFVAWESADECDGSTCFEQPIYSNAFVWDSTTNTTTKLTDHTLPTPFGEPHFSSQVVNDVEVSADGSKVVYSVTDHTTSPQTHAVKVWDRATASTTTVATPAGIAQYLTVSGDASRIAYELADIDGEAQTAKFTVEVWSATPLSVDPVPDADQAGTPHLSRDGARLYYGVGDVRWYSTANLEVDELRSVTLGGSQTKRREIGLQVQVVNEINAGESPELVYHGWDADDSADLLAWTP
jgi:hypothetical protein